VDAAGDRPVTPRSIKVGVLNYRIRPTAHLAVKAHDAVKITQMVESATVNGVYHEDAVIEILGLTNPDEQTIMVESVDAGLDVQAVTLLHEVIHAVFSQVGMRDTLDHNVEEAVIKRQTPLLLQVLRENPKLIEYLTSRYVGGAKSA
jgi:hypothetical protein